MLYDIWSLGYKPFETLANDEVCMCMLLSITTYVRMCDMCMCVICGSACI